MMWFRFVAGRIGGALVTLVIASFLIMAATEMTPGSALTALTGGRALPPETLESLTQRYHLDDPLLVRYGKWVNDLLHGHLGYSIVYSDDVSRLIGERAGSTVLLVVMSGLLLILTGVGLGIVAGLRQGLPDRVVMLGSSVTIAVPSFVMASLLVTLCAVRLGWFPSFGSGSGGLDSIWHMVLPSIAMALTWWGYVTRNVRAAVREQADSEHVLTARSRGLERRTIVTRHVLRNAMIPVVTLGGVTAAGMIAGSVIIESVFGLNGLGELLVQAVKLKDFAVVQGTVLLFLIVFIVISTLVDLVYGRLDPRVRAQAKGDSL